MFNIFGSIPHAIPGLVGETDLDQARGDMIVDYVEDMVKDFPGIFFPETEEQVT